MKNDPIETLGLVGGNLLAAMIAVEAQKRGIQTVLLEPEVGNIASEVCNTHITAPITTANIKRLALKSDAIIFCTSTIPVLSKDILKTCITYPKGEGIDFVANRVQQLIACDLTEVPVPNYYHQSNKLTFFKQIADVEMPFRLYQLYPDRYEVMDIYTKDDLEEFIYELDDSTTEWLIEEIHEYDRILSISVLKAGDKVYTYPIQEEILNDEAVKYIYMPASITKTMQGKITKLAKKLLKEVGTEGLFTLKFGMKKNRQIELMNVNPGITVGDIATNHYTDFSIYEQFLNLVEGLPVKDGELVKPSVTTVIKESDVSHRPDFPYHRYTFDRYNKLPVNIYIKENITEA
ncbi:ATP-grasp domain-containing protein [Niameybacter massiliensis]|uniref:ATP-grasp domain-containing protein n=1 Tax=Niameybacter massiliensis TaxID=1658108 RepID=UPI0006B51C22|nr:ATP-grasp domain-containing protein [Niameybacter massiliensis]